MFIYGESDLGVTAGDIVLVVWVLSLPIMWRIIHWFSFVRPNGAGTLQREACNSLEDFEEFLWCLDLGMDDLDGIVIREVEDG